QIYSGKSAGVPMITLGADGRVSANSNIETAGSLVIRNGSPTIYLQDTDGRSGMIHQNGNIMHFLRGSGTDSSGWTSTGNGWPLTINMENNDATFGGRIYTLGNG
ncbi:hypothetical protein, partial [Sphingobium sp. LSP13-1-1.1]|uniref:hypothetical protein n=1 Tax=Sphingobium sp. LSP13-1-1.1 TaxID=3135234 RepID=UPI00343EC082